VSYQRKTHDRVFLCGGNFDHLLPRGDCLNVLHDWPLPAGYIEAGEVAGARLRARWANKRCPDCGLYGWTASDKRPAGTNPVMVPAEHEEQR
jgi:hypothetical protein